MIIIQKELCDGCYVSASLFSPQCHSLCIVWALIHLIYFSIDLFSTAIYRFLTPPTPSLCRNLHLILPSQALFLSSMLGPCVMWWVTFFLSDVYERLWEMVQRSSTCVSWRSSANVLSVIGIQEYRQTDALFSVIIYSSNHPSWSDAPREALPSCVMCVCNPEVLQDEHIVSYDWQML